MSQDINALEFERGEKNYRDGKDPKHGASDDYMKGYAHAEKVEELLGELE